MAPKTATCLLCEAACGIVVEVEEGRVGSIRGDKDDPMSRGFVCPKVIGMKDLHEDPDRLRAPLVRKDGELREASWAEALDAAASGLRRIRQTYGRDALAVYQGNPAAHNLGLLTIGQVVLRSFRTKNLYSASSADQVPHMLAAELMFGNPVFMPVPDLDRTAHFLIFGANPVVSNGSIMTAPDMKSRIERIRARGGRVVVVDPRKTETARLADEHVFVRPASDPQLLASMLHVIFEEGLVRTERIRNQVRGLEELGAVVRAAPPERFASVTGISADQVRKLARDFAAAPAAAAYGRVGICHQPHGTIASWLLYALNAVTGNLDRPGGAMFSRPAVELHKLVRILGFIGHDRYRSRVRGLPEVAGELPVATLADEIEEPGAGQVRALLTCAGNPVLSAPNGARIERALGKLAFMVSIDPFLNETTRHADVVLPPVSVLERSHYDVALNGFAVRNVAKYVSAPIEAPADGKHDWQILMELAARVRVGNGFAGSWVRRAAVRAGTTFGPEGLLETLLRVGPYRLSLAKLREHPHGLDLGALEPCLDRMVETASKKVELSPPKLVAELKTLLAEEQPAPSGRLSLVGRRHLRSNNSWLHNSRSLVKGPARCTLLMHPSDASALELTNGATVEVRSRVGSVEIQLEVSDEIMPGVVSMPHGFGHDRAKTTLRVAGEHAGVSINDLTDDLLLDASTGNAAFSGVPVQVRALTSAS